jgi:Putative adhesin
MIVSFAVVFALLAAAPADRPPASPPPARERHLHLDLHGFDMPDFDFDLRGFEMPDLDLSDLHLSGLRSLETLRDLGLRGPGLLAMRDEDEEDQDPDEEASDAGTSDRATRERDRANRERDRATRDRDRWGRWDRSRWGSFDDKSFGEQPGARATGKNGAASLAVKGPVTFRLRVQSGEVEVVPSDKPQIALSVGGVPIAGEVQLLQFGDRIEAEFGGHRQLRRGKLRVELPKGSNLEFDSTSGDVAVQDVGGDVRVRTMSGDVKVKGARNADVQSVSGDVTVNVTGPKLRLHLVSGTAFVTTADPAVQVAFQSASGNLEWRGVCAKGCHLVTETVSGDIKLQPDAAKSSFQLSYASHSGDLRDELNLEVKRAPNRKHGMGGWVEAVYGRGEGVIECDAFSGDVIVSKK